MLSSRSAAPAIGPGVRSLLAAAVPASALVMSHERLLPVPSALAPLFGLSGDHDAPALVRGHTVGCTGSAAMSCALALMGSVTRAGSWAAIVGLPSAGVVAAADMGVALERTVFVADPRRGTVTADAGTIVASLIDGFEMVVLAAPLVAAIGTSGLRRLQSRAHTKGALLVLVGEQRTASTDLHIVTEAGRWQGLGDGHGHLQRRRVRVVLEGRRRARPTTGEVWLPDCDGRIASTTPVSGTSAGSDAGTSAGSDTGAGVVVPFPRAG